MNVEDKHDESEPEDPHPTDRESEQEPTDSPDLRLEKRALPFPQISKKRALLSPQG